MRLYVYIKGRGECFKTEKQPIPRVARWADGFFYEDNIITRLNPFLWKQLSTSISRHSLSDKTAWCIFGYNQLKIMLPLFGGIGLFYLVFNIGAILTLRKFQKEGSDHHVSGIPFLGGIHILIAGLISPIKWLALLCVPDYTFWSFLYAVFSSEPSRRTRTQKRNEEGLNYDVIITL